MLIVIILCVCIVVSATKFRTINFPKVIGAIVSISNGKTDYVELKTGPNKIVIASPENTMNVFEEYIAENGYSVLEDEQLGSLFVIARGEKREYVFISINKYYSLWQWAENSVK